MATTSAKLRTIFKKLEFFMVKYDEPIRQIFPNRAGFIGKFTKEMCYFATFYLMIGVHRRTFFYKFGYGKYFHNV